MGRVTILLIVVVLALVSGLGWLGMKYGEAREEAAQQAEAVRIYADAYDRQNELAHRLQLQYQSARTKEARALEVLNVDLTRIMAEDPDRLVDNVNRGFERMFDAIREATGGQTADDHAP